MLSSRFLLRACLAGLCGVLATGAFAQVLPKPAEFYFDKTAPRTSRWWW